MIGVDEAGYGPNLGPLCIAATAWHVDEPPGATQAASRSAGTATATAALPCLYERLSGLVAQRDEPGRLVIADSKVVYKAGSGLGLLEKTVLAALGGQIRGFRALLTALGLDARDFCSQLPWYADYDPRLPVDAVDGDVTQAGDLLSSSTAAASIELALIQSRLVCPSELNDLIDRYGTKGAALSHVTLALVRKCVDRVTTERPGEVRICCDKHGGRNHYLGLLQHHFPEHWISTSVESRQESRYAWEGVEICFRARGESDLPTALASMTAKYLRELCMRAFNDFWARHAPDLKPTAGYPLDARRFRADIAESQRALKIDDRLLWRRR